MARRNVPIVDMVVRAAATSAQYDEFVIVHYDCGTQLTQRSGRPLDLLVFDTRNTIFEALRRETRFSATRRLFDN